MNIEDFRTFCLKQKGVSEGFPFDENVLAFKVMDKIFALTGLNNSSFTVNLKCEPKYAEELRGKYESINPGWHMNKKHWNTVNFNSIEFSESFLKELILHSYNLVVLKLNKKNKEAYKELK